MKKLLEEIMQRKAEPGVELLLAEISGILRLLLNRCRLVVYQKYGDVVWNAKAFLELSFGQK